MAHDTGAHKAIPAIDLAPAKSQDRRGPLRPERLRSARTRVSGANLARLFQVGDVVALALASLLSAYWVGAPKALCFSAPAIAILLLVTAGGYAMTARERAWTRYGRL